MHHPFKATILKAMYL